MFSGTAADYRIPVRLSTAGSLPSSAWQMAIEACGSLYHEGAGMRGLVFFSQMPGGRSTEERNARRRVAPSDEWLVHGQEAHDEGDQCLGMHVVGQEVPTLQIIRPALCLPFAYKYPSIAD